MGSDGSESNVEYKRGCYNITCSDPDKQVCITDKGKKVGDSISDSEYIIRRNSYWTLNDNVSSHFGDELRSF